MALEGAKAGLNLTPPLPPLLYRRVVVPNASVKALFTTPFTLIPAQGASKAIVPEYFHIHKPAGVAFANGTNIQILWTGSGTTLLGTPVAGFLDQTAKKTVVAIQLAFNAYNFGLHVALNTDLIMNITGANPITGDSDLFVGVIYRIWEDSPTPWF